MPLFISDSELQAAGSDVSLVAQRADAFILDLSQKLEALKARADAAAITSEQRCSAVEQKFLAISAQFRETENTKMQLENTLQSRSAELSQAQAQVHKLELESVRPKFQSFWIVSSLDRKLINHLYLYLCMENLFSCFSIKPMQLHMN
jgi:nucleoprotein TPR